MPTYKPIPKNGPRLVVSNPLPPIHAALCDAINTRHQIAFIYQGKPRVVEPHDYGIKNGSPKLLVYQLRATDDDPRSGAEGWRLLDVSKIATCTVLEDSFPGSRAPSSRRHGTWDEVFARVA